MNNQINTNTELSNSLGVHMIEHPIIINNVEKGKETEYSGKLNDGTEFKKKVIDYVDTTENIKIHKEVYSSTNSKVENTFQNFSFPNVFEQINKQFENMTNIFGIFPKTENKKSKCIVEEVID